MFWHEDRSLSWWFWLAVPPSGLLITGSVLLLLSGDYALAGLIAGAVACAALFVVWLRRPHRSKSKAELRSKLRATAESDSVEWEE